MLFPAAMPDGNEAGPEEQGAAAEAGQAAPAVTRVLMGHSMGCVCAVAEAIKNPEVGMIPSTIPAFHMQTRQCAAEMQC